MSNIEQVQDTKPRPSIRRFAGIVAVFVLLGPPAGGLAVALWLAAVTASSDLVVGGMSGWLRVFAGAAIFSAAFGLPLSYVAGLIPASVIGLATATWDARRGAISLYVALGGAVALGLLAVLRVGNPISVSEVERIGQVSLLLAHLAAAGLCWLIAREIFGRPASIEHNKAREEAMNAHHPTVPGRSRPHSRSWGRFAGIVAFYGLLGPLIGAVGVNGLFTLMAIGNEIVKGNFGDIGRLLVGGIVVGIIVSLIIAYTFGIVSAAAVGLAVAIRDRREGGISWRVALIAALAAWLLTSVTAITVVPPDGLAQWAGALLIAHLLAAAVCTWIARRVFR